MKETNVTVVNYTHVLAKDTTYDCYGTDKVLKAGHIFTTTTKPKKQKQYEMILGHGVRAYIENENVELWEVTVNTTTKRVNE